MTAASYRRCRRRHRRPRRRARHEGFANTVALRQRIDTVPLNIDIFSFSLFFSLSLFHSTRSSDFAAFTRRKSFTPRDLRLRFFYPAPATSGWSTDRVSMPQRTLLSSNSTFLLSPARCIFSAAHSYQPSTGIARNDLAKCQVEALINARSTRTTGSAIVR